ncbi:universal stress protein [Sphingomonas sp. MMS24-J45]|uniref:universal stress protein n=1 Tax=Sphingomonas sp. MMS24-J45 TaxID=3238806 RepID=UPI00384C404C
MIKDILLVIDASPRTDPIIRAACGLAERVKGTLTIEILSAGPMLIPTLAPMTAAYVPDVELVHDEADRIAAVTAMVAGCGATVRVIGIHDDVPRLAERVGKGGPIADLILIGDADLWAVGWLRGRIAEAVIMGGGTPLIVLNGAATLDPVHHAVIGWKDTSEARRALHDLVALAAPHAKIAVVAIARNEAALPKLAEGMKDVVRHLSAHGFEASAHALPADGQNVAEALQDFALREGADVLAIGAFGHSRLREVVFGGVTLALIEHARLPVLLSR